MSGSGSGGDSVQISINADSGDFSQTMVSAMTDAQKFNAILKSVNNDLAKAAAIWDQGAEAIARYAAALGGSSNAAKAAQEAVKSLTMAAVSTEDGFKSAAESAAVFTKALNPTPLQALRRLMGDEMPAAFRMVQTATLGVVEEMTGLNRSFVSAAESAAVFVKAANPTPLQQYRATLTAIAAGNKVVSTSIGEVIAEQVGLNTAFTSAAESARTFMAALNPTPLQAFRAAMSEELPAGLRLTSQTMEQAVAAATGLGATFKNAAESAEVFKRGLDPTPLMQMRQLMGDEVPAAVTHTTTTITDLIDAMTRDDEATKSAAASAQIFARAMGETIGPTAALRDLMSKDLPAGLRHTTTEIGELIDGFTRESSAAKSAADSAAVFARALGEVQTPLQRVRTLMATNVPGAFKLTQQATREVINELTGLDREFKSAEESARAFNQALDPSPLQRTRQLLADVEPAAGHAQHGVAMLGHEFIVLGHEAMMGNYSRIPGTLLVLAEYSGGLTSRMMQLASEMTAMGWAGAAAVAAIAAAFVTLVIRAHEATVAVREAMNAATMQGRDPGQAAASVKAAAEGMKQVGVMGHNAAYEIASAINSLSNVGEDQKAKLQALGTQFFLNWGSDAKKAVSEIDQIFASDSSLKTYLDKQHLLSTDQQSGWAAATTAAQKYEIGIAAITARIGPMGAQIKQAQADARANLMAQMAAGAEGTPFVATQGKGDTVGPQSLGDFQPGTKQDMAAEADRDAVIAGNKHLQEKIDLEARLAAQQRDLAAATKAGDAAEQQAARSAISATTAQIEMWKAAGDANWAGKQEAALNQILLKVAAGARSAKQLAEDENRAKIDFWDKAAKQADLTESQITLAQANATRARLLLKREELTGGAAAAKQGLLERLAELNREQEAEKDNFDKVREIEQQKLAVIRAALGERSKLYQDELKKEIALERAHKLDVARVAEEELTNKRSQDQAAFQIEKDLDDEAVLEHKMTKEKEIADLRSFADQQHAVQLQIADGILAGLDEQSDAYKTFYAKVLTMKRQWAAEDAKLAREAVQADAAERDKALAPFESSISGQVSALMRGTETMHQAVQKMAANIVTEYATMAVKSAVQTAAMFAWDVGKTVWAEAMKTSAAATGAAARQTVKAGETAADTASLGVRLGHWIAAQLGMTAATTAATATQTSTVVAGQAAQTAAVVTGVTAQESAKAAARASGAAVQAATASASIMGAAYQAAAHTYASVSAIPYVGWILAPVAAAGAFAAVAAYNVVTSLDVGAWNLPRDMPANLHAGEMVIPQNFAEGMRRGGGIGGGNTTQNLNYSPRFSGGDGGQSASQMRQQSAAFKSYMWHATRNGALNLPHGH